MVFSATSRAGILVGMTAQTADTFTLSGNHLHKVSQLLRLAQRYARIAGDIHNARVQDVLAELEDELSDRLAALDDAVQDDRAAEEESGDAERMRRAYFSPYRAA
jgi:hypothetical protein